MTVPAGHVALLGADMLGRRFGPRWIFRSISLDLTPGMALAVLGSNGAGKSTLLKVLSGLLEPSEGHVHRPPDMLRDLGYASLDLAVYPAITAREHMEMAATLRAVPDRSDELLDFVGLIQSRDVFAGKFSTGMRSRLKLALAIQTRPAVLLLDEPSASLDRQGDELLDRLVSDQLERGALVIATNDPKDLRHATHELVLGG